MTSSAPLRRALAGALLALTAGAAFAHHGEGMRVPTTWLSGAAGGIAHPVLDFAHLGFLLALGVLALRSGRAAVLLGVFTAATLAGAGAHVAGIEPLGGAGLEFWVAATALIAAAAVAWRARMGTAALAAIALAGLLHGSAYAESVEGARLAVLAAYFAGVFAVQALIAVAAALAVRFASRRGWASRMEGALASAAAMFGIAAIAPLVS